jgi:hypothetical protein
MTSLSDRVTLGASTPVMEKGSASAATTSETSLYAKRNAKIAEIANSGKSRWGTAEVSKVQTLMASAGINGATATTAAAVAVAVPTTPVSHSNRVNIGVAEVTGGTAATTEDKDSSTSTSLYAKRNAKIAEISHSGKSRWGTAEDSKVQTLMASAGINGATATNAAAVVVPTTPVSHSNRVNIGVAAVTGGTAATTEDKDSSTSTSLYAKRNAKIAKIAHSGKSRWGTAEVSKVQTLVTCAGVNVMAPTVEEPIPSVASVVKAAPSKPSVSVNQGGGNFFSDSTAYRNCGTPKTNRKRPRTPRRT